MTNTANLFGSILGSLVSLPFVILGLVATVISTLILGAVAVAIIAPIWFLCKLGGL